jgi:hypothetical protein
MPGMGGERCPQRQSGRSGLVRGRRSGSCSSAPFQRIVDRFHAWRVNRILVVTEVGLVGARHDDQAGKQPPKPAPTITTRCRWSVICASWSEEFIGNTRLCPIVQGQPDEPNPQRVSGEPSSSIPSDLPQSGASIFLHEAPARDCSPRAAPRGAPSHRTIAWRQD